MAFWKGVVSRWPAIALAFCGGTIAAGIILSISLVWLDSQGPWKWYVAIFLLSIPPTGWAFVAQIFKIGLRLTRYETAVSGIVFVLATWLGSLLAILVSVRHFDVGAWVAIHFVVEFAVAIIIPFLWRYPTAWYRHHMWPRKLKNVLQQANVAPGLDLELEGAAQNTALPQAVNFALAGSWALSAVLSNFFDPSYLEDTAVSCLMVSSWTTCSMLYYYLDPEQCRIRKLIRTKYGTG